MKRSTIDASRELRLWISQVVVPAVMCGTALLNIPDVRDKAKLKYYDMKWAIQDKIAGLKEVMK